MIVETDQGDGYLKALGSDAGPHVLACEWIGTSLAGWLGLPTFAFATIDVTAEVELRFHSGKLAAPGPAFISRAESGRTWGGSAKDLRLVGNREATTRLVVLDTWIRNRDRHPPVGCGRRPNYDNVFLADRGGSDGKLCLLAMDHTHCLGDAEEIPVRLGEAQFVRDERVYGLFPPFRTSLERQVVRGAAHRLRGMVQAEAQAIVDGVPPEWEVAPSVRAAVIDFIVKRAQFVAGDLEGRLFPQGEFDFGGPEGVGP